MDLQVLVATVDQRDASLIDKMGLASDAVIMNQAGHTGHVSYERDFGRVDLVTTPLRGVGRNRNMALLWSDADICLFADDDVVYYPDYPDVVRKAFTRHTEADVLIFNFQVENPVDGRAIPQFTDYHRIKWRDGLSYGGYRIAVRREAVQAANIYFSTLFGGGARYGSGEDSLFVAHCLRSRLGVFASPETLGTVSFEESSWFSGFNCRYLVDKGALFQALWGRSSYPYMIAFIGRHRDKFGPNITPALMLRLMRRGARDFEQIAGRTGP